MKTKHPSLRPSSSTAAPQPTALAHPRDENRYRAEHPGKKRRVSKMQLQRWLLIALLALMILGLVSAHAADSVPDSVAAPSDADHDRLRSRIEAILQRTKTPGAGIALVRRDGPEWIAGIGLADVAARTPATPDTFFRIGSTSKAFVALALLELEQEGKLRLDDTLASRAPDLWFSNPWEQTDPIRLVHLLEHTTGWDDLGLRDYASDPPEELTLRAGLDLRPISRTSRWRPGTCYSYSNAGPAAAAYVVEKITGQRFEDYIEQNWFRPLGMTGASYFGTPEVLSRLTKLYHADGLTTYPYWKISVRPSGAINTSARHMANYVQFHLTRGEFDGARLLPEAAFARIEQPATTFAARAGIPLGYGLYNYATVHEQRTWHGHNGGVRGGLTEFSYLPEAGVGYVVMLNSLNTRALSEITQLIRRHLTRSLSVPPVPSASPVRVSADVVRGYRGWYVLDTPRNEIARFLLRLTTATKIDITGSRLRLNRQTWLPVSDHLFRRENEPAASLVLVPDRSDGTFVQTTTHLGGATLRRVSGAWLALVFGTAALAGLLALSTLVFACVWIPRKFLGRLRDAGPLSVRTLPLLATLSFSLLVAVAFASARGMDTIDTFGRITPWSIGLFVLTLALPALSLAGLVQALWRRAQCVNRLAWSHALATSLVLTLVSAYLAWHGIVGLRTWS